MKKVLMAILISFLIITTNCVKKEKNDNRLNDDSQVVKYFTVVASGYGETKERAVEDAKNDALRQFGFNTVNNSGKPELSYAGKIVSFKIINDYSEVLKNGMWWEIKVEAQIEKL
ncbi:MAG: hypothetical protein L6407_08685 [Candidatus Delongbacteria bacterium]|nr:hypothetical protein [Candidatus Delongbacteria bacterium]